MWIYPFGIYPFGGPRNACEDDVAHYVRCAIMWSLIADVTSFRPPYQSLERIGIRQPSKQNLHTIAAVFQAYHGTKKWLKDSTTDLHIFLSSEPNLVTSVSS